VICVSVWLCFCGCAGVVPLPKRVKGQGGGEQARDVSFIHAGQTPRTEVEGRLKQFDVGINSQQFFIARWASSTWGAFACCGLGEGGAAGRHWGNENLLVEFDNAGNVKRNSVFSDQQLVARLTPVVALQPSLDLSRPVEIKTQLLLAASGWHLGKIILTPGVFTFKEEAASKKPRTFQVAAANITSIGSSRGAHVDPVYTLEVVHFDKKIKTLESGLLRLGSHSAYFKLTVPDLMTVLKFVEQSKSSGYPVPSIIDARAIEGSHSLGFHLAVKNLFPDGTRIIRDFLPFSLLSTGQSVSF
jgi:hypothetical protein